MVEYGFLFSSTIYPSLAHNPKEINKFGQALDFVLHGLAIDLKCNKDLLASELECLGPIEKSFSRTQSL